MSRKQVIWIISEGSPGHISQSTGLAVALAKLTPVETFQFETRPRIPGFLRSWIRVAWMGKSGRPLPNGCLHRAFGLERKTEDSPAPDLIIASGGRSAFAARSLSVKHGVPLIWIGEHTPFPATWFHTVFTPSALETAPNAIRMDLIPTKITPEIVQQAAADWKEKPQGRLWTMLIGGSSRSHDFQDDDWKNLAKGMIRLAQRENIRWLVSTSRRTGKATEEKLRQRLPSAILADQVWWCHQPEKRLAAYLGAAETVWVTQDSVSMITEAVASGNRVVATYPAHTPFPTTSYMNGYYQNLESLDFIQRVPIAEMHHYQLLPRPEHLKTVDPSALAMILRDRLHWPSTQP